MSFADAKKAFRDPKAVISYDQKHSNKLELRWWLLGNVGHRVMLVRYTHRPDGLIRLIGAGYWRDGKEIYEKAQHEA